MCENNKCMGPQTGFPYDPRERASAKLQTARIQAEAIHLLTQLIPWETLDNIQRELLWAFFDKL